MISCYSIIIFSLHLYTVMYIPAKHIRCGRDCDTEVPVREVASYEGRWACRNIVYQYRNMIYISIYMYSPLQRIHIVYYIVIQ